MYLRIVEYGEHPHTKGMQRIDEEGARRLVAHFHSLRGRLARRFGGLPVYVGHPDDPDYRTQPGHGDTRAHGWVTDLDARPDGLYGRFRWADTGRDLLANAHYKFLSPRWIMQPVGDGTFAPVRLLSIGLTNSPNIPGEAIANEDVPLGSGETAVEACGPGTPAAANGVALHTAALTADLGHRRTGGRSTAIVEAVNARMSATGEDFATAWTNVKRARADLWGNG